MADDPKPVVVSKSNRTAVITIASISVIFVLFVAALWGAGFLTFSGTDPSSKVVAAALALVGGLVAAVVSIVGILLKYSIDQRTDTRLQIEAARAAADRKTESDRANALQTQAEQRLNLEAAIRAVELLGATDNSAAALQRAGALYALSTLNQHKLTLDLASYLLDRGDLEPNVASSLIDRALKTSDESIQADAIGLLYANAKHMFTQSDVVCFPEAISEWDTRLSPFAREWAVFAIGELLMCRPLSVWQADLRWSANTLVAALGLAWESESDERLKIVTGAILKAVLKAFPDVGVIYHSKGPINTDKLITDVAGCLATHEGVKDILERFETWKNAATPPKDL